MMKEHGSRCERIVVVFPWTFAVNGQSNYTNLGGGYAKAAGAL